MNIKMIAEEIINKRNQYQETFPKQEPCSNCQRLVHLETIDDEIIFIDNRYLCSKCLATRGIEKILSNAKVPPRYAKFPFKDYQSNEWTLDAMKSFSEGKWVVICGSPGTGKTHLAINMILESKTRSLFISEGDLLRGYLSELNQYQKNDTIEQVRSVPLLIIDDLGYGLVKSDATANAVIVNRIGELINYRYSYILQTIITANMSISTFAHTFGTYITDRILEVGKFIQIKETKSRR